LVPPQQLQLVGDKLPRCVQHTGFIVPWRAAVGLRFQKVQDFLHGEKLVHSLNHVCSPGRASLRSVTDNADLHKPDEVLDALHLRPTDKVADTGAGTGYFSIRIAERVPDGKVFSVDIEPDMLRNLGERAHRDI
jgi:SAM-dependent methyltransferase